MTRLPLHYLIGSNSISVSDNTNFDVAPTSVPSRAAVQALLDAELATVSGGGQWLPNAADIAARDLVTAKTGDRIIIDDDGDGKWASYIARGDSPTPNWFKLSDEDNLSQALPNLSQADALAGTSTTASLISAETLKAVIDAQASGSLFIDSTAASTNVVMGNRYQVTDGRVLKMPAGSTVGAPNWFKIYPPVGGWGALTQAFLDYDAADAAPVAWNGQALADNDIGMVRYVGGQWQIYPERGAESTAPIEQIQSGTGTGIPGSSTAFQYDPATGALWGSDPTGTSFVQVNAGGGAASTTDAVTTTTLANGATATLTAAFSAGAAGNRAPADNDILIGKGPGLAGTWIFNGTDWDRLAGFDAVEAPTVALANTAITNLGDNLTPGDQLFLADTTNIGTLTDVAATPTVAIIGAANPAVFVWTGAAWRWLSYSVASGGASTPPTESPLLDDALQAAVEAEFAARAGQASTLGSEMFVAGGTAGGAWAKLTDGWRLLANDPPLQVGSWADFEALDSELTDKYSRVELLKYLGTEKRDSPRIFERVATSGVEYCNPTETWYSLPETMVAGTRFSMPRNQDEALRIYESVAGAKGADWDATEEARFTLIGEQLNNAGTTIVTTSGARYIAQEATFQGMWQVEYFGVIDNAELASGASTEVGRRFGRLRLAALAAEVGNKALLFGSNSYRVSTIRPPGAETKLTVKSGIEHDGRWIGKGKASEGTLISKIWFNVDTDPANAGVTFNDLDVCLQNRNGSFRLEGLTIQGPEFCTLENVDDWVDPTTWDAEPTWAQITATKPGLVGVRSKASGSVPIINTQISQWKIGLDDADQTGHRRRKKLQIDKCLIGRAISFWGGDSRFDACSFTTNGLCDILVYKGGMATETYINCHFGLGGAVSGIFQINDGITPGENFDIEPSQTAGMRECTFIGSSMEGNVTASIILLPGATTRDLTIIGGTLHGGAGAWNGHPRPASFEAWNPGLEKYTVQIGKLEGSLSFPGTLFSGGTEKNLYVRELTNEELDLTGVSSYDIGDISTENRIWYPEQIELESNTIPQAQQLNHPPALIGGGNLLGVGNRDMNLAASWSTLNNSVLTVLEHDDPSIPAAFPEKWKHMIGESKVFRLEGVGNLPHVQRTLGTSVAGHSSEHLSPQDGELWGSMFVLGDVGRSYFSLQLEGNAFRAGTTQSGSDTEWQFVPVPAISTGGLKVISCRIRGTTPDSTLYFVAPMLSYKGFAKYSRFKRPQFISHASDDYQVQMRLVPPTSTPGPAQWEVYS